MTPSDSGSRASLVRVRVSEAESHDVRGTVRPLSMCFGRVWAATVRHDLRDPAGPDGGGRMIVEGNNSLVGGDEKTVRSDRLVSWFVGDY